jgi:Rieske Fe-S protein
VLPHARIAAADTPAPESADPGSWLDLGPSSSLTLDGPAAFPFVHPARESDGRRALAGVVFVTSLEANGVQALSNICPHQGCRVHWDEAGRVYACPCHHASFAPDGRVLAGPPQAPLEQFPARVWDGRVQIKLDA